MPYISDDDEIKKIKKMFIEANIPRRLHFTKLGYFKLYRDTKYWYSHYIQVIAFIALCIAIYFLVIIVLNKSPEYQEATFRCFAIAASLQCGSEFLVGDFKSSAKMLLGAFCFAFICFYFF